MQRRKQRQRQQQLQAALQSGPWLVRVLRQGWLHSSYALADHTRNALILSVFAFKVCTCLDRRFCCAVTVKIVLPCAASPCASDLSLKDLNLSVLHNFFCRVLAE